MSEEVKQAWVDEATKSIRIVVSRGVKEYYQELVRIPPGSDPVPHLLEALIKLNKLREEAVSQIEQERTKSKILQEGLELLVKNGPCSSCARHQIAVTTLQVAESVTA